MGHLDDGRFIYGHNGALIRHNTFGAPAATAYTSYDDMLRDTTLDAIFICTPSGLHCAQIEAALAAGFHVFSEKPLAQTLELCDEAIQAVRAAGVKLQLGFMRRFDAGYALAKQKIDEGVKICHETKNW